MTKKVLVAFALAAVAGTIWLEAGYAHPLRAWAVARQRSPVTITGATVQGRLARVSVLIRGWRAGARLRIFVDGVYNNFSTSPKVGLALNLRPGTHRVNADLLVRGRASARSKTWKITVRQSSDPVLAAAGDIACDPADPEFRAGRGTPATCRAAATARLVAGARPTLVLPLGDLQYECGGPSAFERSYALSWGSLKPISRPVPGNHEYAIEGPLPFAPTCDSALPGAGYFSYFGALSGGAGGYYSYDVGGWHVIALNSECGFIGGCRPGSPEEQWLRSDLAAHPNVCTLAYWHRPRWSGSSARPNEDSLDTFWRDLYAAGAEVVLNGHRHLYIRSAPLDPEGAPDPVGLRQFIVGTGGKSHLSDTAFVSTVESHNDDFGALLLTLHPGAYDWQFEPEQGAISTDYGTGTCR